MVEFLSESLAVRLRFQWCYTHCLLVLVADLCHNKDCLSRQFSVTVRGDDDVVCLFQLLIALSLWFVCLLIGAVPWCRYGRRGDRLASVCTQEFSFKSRDDTARAKFLPSVQRQGSYFAV